MSENYSLEQIVQLFIEKSKEAKRELGQFNILIIGKAGVGKSTLINRVFNSDQAKIGFGRPVTQDIQQYIMEGCPITIYDTPGLELDETKSKVIKQDVAKLIEEKRVPDIKEHIHVIWYCVNDNSNRLEKNEEVWIQKLVKKDEVPLIIVLTQTNDPKISKMLPYLQGRDLPLSAVIPIMAQDKPVTSTISIPAYGLGNLVDETAKLIPEQAERAFIHQQIVSINLQAIQADKYLIAYVISSGFIGFAETQLIPVGSLLALQATMLAQIPVLFGLEFDEKFYTILIAGLAGSKTTEDVGKAVIINLLSLIPGIATVAAGVTAAIAVLMTLALGKAYIEALKWYKEAKVRGEEIALKKLVDKIIELYKKYLGDKDNN
jgi:small GTP-binding protein